MGPWIPSPLFFFPDHLLCSASACLLYAAVSAAPLAAALQTPPSTSCWARVHASSSSHPSPVPLPLLHPCARATVTRAARLPPRRRRHFHARAYPSVSLLLLNMTRRTQRTHLRSLPLYNTRFQLCCSGQSPTSVPHPFCSLCELP
jgi:hypothetical protein